jgi:hypothetical protein
VNSRKTRFGGWNELEALSQSGRIGQLRPFFAGPNVGSRMTKVRKSIQYIRHNWDQYPEFMSTLRLLMVEHDLEGNHDDDLSRRASALFASRKDWIDSPNLERESTTDYDAVRLYTSDQGYRRIFSVVNSIFRSEVTTDFERTVVGAVFLVELLNIDLYNYCWSYPNAKDFEGVVYRGMCISQRDFHAFSQVCQQPISERYISIPLGLVSTSTETTEAEFFLASRLMEDSSQVPLLWRIHVIGLEPQLLSIYHDRFPTSVVSTICSVPVSELSDFPEEREVLLRGPFFQVLNLSQEGEIEGRPVHVVDVVTLNSNRDHFTTAQLGREDARARELFRALVSYRRHRFCVSYCHRHGLDDDAVEYRKQLGIAEKEFQ